MGKILVTGGCGFIGSHIVDALLERGEQPVVLDDLSTGKRNNIPPHVPVIKGSILDKNLLEQAVKGVKSIIHLAAISSVQKCNEKWADTNQINLTGTIQVFDASRKNGNIPVIYASSAAVYGNPKKIPISEMDPICPLNAYGVDKYGCELHAKIAGSVHQVPTVGLRFFNVYGHRQDPLSPYSGVISIFTKRIKENLPLFVFGDGEQKRDFIHVSDVIRHILAAINKADITAPVFNVCTGRETTITKLSNLLGKLYDLNISTIKHPPRDADIRFSVGDPTSATENLNVKSIISLEDGLLDLMSYNP